ncbi:uncharacterized protein VTP21DRAFT_10648 [Calcarisporiella thermophila]|uniref:uncharacterized protein n=1 Tax=Calcarisporiella thermophila TaxID=911321 RepID=UPI0037437FE6
MIGRHSLFLLVLMLFIQFSATLYIYGREHIEGQLQEPCINCFTYPICPKCKDYEKCEIEEPTCYSCGSAKCVLKEECRNCSRIMRRCHLDCPTDYQCQYSNRTCTECPKQICVPIIPYIKVLEFGLGP